jgi:hypothetical protein
LEFAFLSALHCLVKVMDVLMDVLVDLLVVDLLVDLLGVDRLVDLLVDLQGVEGEEQLQAPIALIKEPTNAAEACA